MSVIKYRYVKAQDKYVHVDKNGTETALNTPNKGKLRHAKDNAKAKGLKDK
jgi:hypothetical protein